MSKTWPGFHRAVQLLAALLCVGVPIVASILIGGGLSGLFDLLRGAWPRADVPATETWLFAELVVPPAVGLAVAFYLLSRRTPSRRGLGVAALAMTIPIVVDLLCLSLGSPIFVPSLVGHGGLLMLVGLLHLLQARDRM